MTKEEFQKINYNDFYVVDIREADELIELPGPIGSVHIPMSKVLEEAEGKRLPNDKKIITVCRSGGRCVMLNDYLSKLGYQVDLLEGGVLALNEAT